MEQHESYIPYLLETIKKLEAKNKALEAKNADEFSANEKRWLMSKRIRQLIAENTELKAEIIYLKSRITRVWIEGNVG